MSLTQMTAQLLNEPSGNPEGWEKITAGTGKKEGELGLGFRTH